MTEHEITATLGRCYDAVIEGRTYTICTQPMREDDGGGFTRQWRAWSFFAYDNSMTIYPADSVPGDVKTQETIAGEIADSEDEARSAVEETLRRVVRTKSLEGTGFYSPPADLIYPQEFPRDAEP